MNLELAVFKPEFRCRLQLFTVDKGGLRKTGWLAQLSVYVVIITYFIVLALKACVSRKPHWAFCEAFVAKMTDFAGGPP